MNLPEDLRKPLWQGIAAMILGAIGFLGAKVIQPMSAPFWQYVAPKVPPSILFQLCLLLLLLLLLMSSWVAYLHFPKGAAGIRSKYKFDSVLNMSISKRTGVYFCNLCLYKPEPIEVPLYAVNSNGILTHKCPRCSAFWQTTKT